MSMSALDPMTTGALRDFKDRLRSRYGVHLKTVLLFGSRAGGDFAADSDADVAVFVDAVRDPLTEQLDLVEETFRIALTTGVHIQPWVFEEGSLIPSKRARQAA